ncbi:hypothetical protein NLJ89_g862 [Agrocybe chaxingu]|uniref:G domain-containing protein n=1 Tax=Agrocybe chaxingu TaxID=84603 RepID=A0A9W8TE90_9AGAR|nr:hypothetical protein NLJ89_g862 [Agrocybe chaxingu]
MIQHVHSLVEDDSDVTIAVMGTTGSGKTTFINLASGSSLRVGRGSMSCTNVVQVMEPFELEGRMVTLIDTLGFDDTTKSNTDILCMIGLFLATTYEKLEQQETGRCHLHPSHLRLQDGRHLYPQFQDVPRALLRAHSQERRHCHQHVGRRAELSKELMRLMEKHKKEMQQLQEGMEEAIRTKDEETRRELEIETKKLQTEMNRVQSDATSLVSQYKAEKEQMETRMRQFIEQSQVNAQQAAQASEAQ